MSRSRVIVAFNRRLVGPVSDHAAGGPDGARTQFAIFALLRPASVPRFVALLVAQLAHAANDSPLMTNHWTLVAIGSLAILVNLAFAAVRREGWLQDPGAVYRRVAPVLRVQVVILYLFAAFAKMNTGFFDPALSCAVVMSRDLFDTGPFNWRRGGRSGR